MKILAVEFSSGIRSVALVENGAVIGRAAEHGGRNTRSFALLDQALGEAGAERESIEYIVVGLGPGSYAGIRAAIALAQGWQLAKAIRVLGIPSIECLALQARDEAIRGDLHFLIDAQRGEFYCGATFPGNETGLGPLRLIGADEARRLDPGSLIVEPALLPQFPGAKAMSPDAAALGRLAATRSNFVPAETLEPVYLRPASFVKAPPPRLIPSR
ncbi:MAG: tRNA threonylcarbamoyladenosine biosynthesis protein TsaB [Verrucomicrobiota bacterium]|jgi:tRNA threonylcarbamoyladenosine biosynthesis protein TsaB